ncbi:Acyl-coenzyme A thioesterase PaaI, contains HGG motif [Mesobacillus persicus]|uniref:Acyl-coenzyme A thioesterase PaaI, contains HGG motif n=1 Tax=Mesobacillus persicus TaxID=930146 RepID=A0A1H8HMB8_9BACI|nr:PaaI family thioesterase [Mesobacillus persicus]SEN57350.1 Acyl-coenzyme A thioesterase PaaI, contains HGG motif [Mesobacillus persicus]
MDKILHAIQDDYADDYSWCFGCGRLNESGYQFRTGWDGKRTLTIFEPNRVHMAIPGFVYGGVVASLIDCHGTGSASIYLHRKNGHEIGDGIEPPRFVTASLHVDFRKPTPQEVVLKAYGEGVEIHPKKWKIETEVYANETLVATGEVIAVVAPSTFLNK